jgi:hypothetical protein
LEVIPLTLEQRASGLLPEILKEAGEATNWSVSLTGLGMASDLVENMRQHGEKMWSIYRWLSEHQTNPSRCVLLLWWWWWWLWSLLLFLLLLSLGASNVGVVVVIVGVVGITVRCVVGVVVVVVGVVLSGGGGIVVSM